MPFAAPERAKEKRFTRPPAGRAMPDAPRAVLVTSFGWPKPGGLERVVELEAKELHRRGFEVHVVCARSDHDPVAWLKTPDIRVHRSPYRYHSFLPGFVFGFFFALWSARTLRRLAKGARLVHAHNTFAALCALVAGVRRRAVLHLHSVSSEDWKLMEAGGLPLAARLLLRLDAWVNLVVEHLVYNLVPAVCAVSEYELEDARRKMRHPERAHLVRNGVDTALFRPDDAARREVRAKLGLRPDEPLVLFLGRFVPKNGTLVIAAAVPEATALGARPRWVFVGTGTEEPAMRALFAQRGVDNVHFLPPQASERLYAACDVFVSHVSTSVEGHGLTVVEAMACGAPTVTGRDRIKEALFRDGEDLVFVPKDDPVALARAVGALLGDEPRRARLAEGGRRKVERDLSVRAQVDAILAVAPQP